MIVRVWWFERYEDGHAYLGLIPPPLAGSTPRRPWDFMQGCLAFFDRITPYTHRLLDEAREI